MEIGEKHCEICGAFKLRAPECDLFRSRRNRAHGPREFASCGIDEINLFADAPVARRARAPNKREIVPGAASRNCSPGKIISPVVRLHRKAFFRMPDQFGRVIGASNFLADSVFPLLCSLWAETPRGSFR